MFYLGSLCYNQFGSQAFLLTLIFWLVSVKDDHANICDGFRNFNLPSPEYTCLVLLLSYLLISSKWLMVIIIALWLYAMTCCGHLHRHNHEIDKKLIDITPLGDYLASRFIFMVS